MPSTTYAGRTVQIDSQGYMTDPEEWSAEVGEAIARQFGVWPLTEDHWRVLAFCQEYAAEMDDPPGIRVISARLGISTRQLYLLFPKGPGKLAARIAGLPKPTSCL